VLNTSLTLTQLAEQLVVHVIDFKV